MATCFDTDCSQCPYYKYNSNEDNACLADNFYLLTRLLIMLSYVTYQKAIDIDNYWTDHWDINSEEFR